MRNNLEHFDANLCEKLFDFICPDEKNMTRKEVQAELQHLNINMRAAKDKLDMALNAYYKKQEAQASLQIAREKRLTLLEKLKQIKVLNLPTLRNELREMIAQHLSAPLQSTYFHKLEEAASEKDLQGLMEDILRLESLNQDLKNEEQQS